MRTGVTIDLTAADRRRLEAIVGDRNSPQKHVWRAEIVLLTADGSARPRSCAGRASRRPASGAGRSASCRGRRRRPAARQDPAVAHPAARAEVASTRVVALTADRSAGRDDALDRRRDGQGGRHQRQLGAAHLAQPRPAAAPDRRSSCPTTRSSPPSCATSSASMSIRRRMPSCSRSTRRARSRRSTAPSPACR